MNICDQELCTGCGACRNVCPINAIYLLEDRDARPVAQINPDVCNSCGLCAKVCPVIYPVSRNRSNFCYAAWLKDDTMHSASSSGGAARAFSNTIIDTGGVVFGAKWNDRLEVEHVAAQTKESITSFCGSKYIQSETGLSYADAKRYLQTGHNVLYIGTSCQIAGLRGILGCSYDGLFTIDLICHGVPPASYWKSYLRSIIDIRAVSNASFRDNTGKRLTLFQKDKVLYTKPLSRDYYYLAFENKLCFRENCYRCAYATQERVSDITIGDFWGLKREALKQKPPNNVSIILINSKKGLSLFELAKQQMFFEERPLMEGILGNACLSAPSKRHPDRDLFLKAYRKSGFLAAVKATSLRSMYIRNNFRHFARLPLKMMRSLISDTNVM